MAKKSRREKCAAAGRAVRLLQLQERGGRWADEAEKATAAIVYSAPGSAERDAAIRTAAKLVD